MEVFVQLIVTVLSNRHGLADFEISKRFKHIIF